MSQPPNDTSGQPTGESGDRPTYGQPGYGTPAEPPTYGQRASPPATYGQPSYGQAPTGAGAPQYPPQQPQYGQQGGWSQPTAAQYGTDVRQTEAGYAQMYGEKPRTGMAIAALVLGILGLLGSPWPVASYVAVVLAILAVIFGIIGIRRSAGKGMAMAGLILGGIALVISIVASVFWTRVGADIIQITQECVDQTGSSSGPAFEQCVNDRSENYNPFD